MCWNAWHVLETIVVSIKTYWPGFLLIFQDLKKTTTPLQISISSKWELILFCVALCPQISERGAYPSQPHSSCDTLQIPEGSNTGHSKTYYAQEAKGHGLFLPLQGEEKPHGEQRKWFKYSFHLAQQAQGFGQVLWLAWRGYCEVKELSPWRTLPQRCCCRYSFASYYCLSYFFFCHWGMESLA